MVTESCIFPHWTALHAYVKNEFTKDESTITCLSFFGQTVHAPDQRATGVAVLSLLAITFHYTMIDF